MVFISDTNLKRVWDVLTNDILDQEQQTAQSHGHSDAPRIQPRQSILPKLISLQTVLIVSQLQHQRIGKRLIVIWQKAGCDVKLSREGG
jgi:hypothetical protein